MYIISSAKITKRVVSNIKYEFFLLTGRWTKLRDEIWNDLQLEKGLCARSGRSTVIAMHPCRRSIYGIME